MRDFLCQRNHAIWALLGYLIVKKISLEVACTFARCATSSKKGHLSASVNLHLAHSYPNLFVVHSHGKQCNGNRLMDLLGVEVVRPHSIYVA